MFDHLDELTGWCSAGLPVGVATVVSTWSSAPRRAGSSLVVAANGDAIGNVSSGCVEAEVYELARAAATGAAPLLRRYGAAGAAESEALEPGLTCGGAIEVFIEPVGPAAFPELHEVAAAVRAGSPVVVCTCIEAPGLPHALGRRLVCRPDGVSGSLGTPSLDGAAVESGYTALRRGDSTVTDLRVPGHDAPVRLFLNVSPASPRMIVFGALSFAGELAALGRFLGYRVTVCDARPAFATAARLPAAHDVVVDRPDRYLSAEAGAGRIDGRTVLAVLTHDTRFELPLLEVALRLPVGFVGALGSRRSHAERVRLLRAAGVEQAAIDRLSAPIGLDLGAATPEETAVSIAAEIIAHARGGSGAPLSRLAGPIHLRTAADHRTPDRVRTGPLVGSFP